MLSVVISPSKLESFRLWRDFDFNGKITKQDLINRISGVTHWNKKSMFGTAFGAILRYGAKRFRVYDDVAKKYVYVVQCEGMPYPLCFCYDEIKAADNFNKTFNQATWEVWNWGEIKINNYLVKIPMRADMINGSEIHENKTTQMAIKPDSYYKSMQWRLYLYLLHPAEFIQYNVFKYSENRNADGKFKYSVSEFDSFQFFKHPNLEIEIRQCLFEFIQFVEENGLLKHIKSKK